MKSGRGSTETVLEHVAGQFPSAVAVYYFGSAASGHAGPLSDIDVAVLLDESDSARETWGRLRDALCRALRTERVDLILLSETPPPLAYRIIRDGHLVFCRDEKRRQVFETGTVMRYLDFKPLRDQAFRVARSRILGTS